MTLRPVDPPFDYNRIIKERAERGSPEALGHGWNVGESALVGNGGAQRVGVIGAVRQQDRAGSERVEHQMGAVSVIGLALAQDEADRQAIGIDHGMYLGRQPAARATPATGSVVFFLGVGAMLVNTDRRAVDHLDVARISLRNSIQ